jgi:hypothetical protein
VVVVHWLPAVGVTGVQVRMPVGPVRTIGHVVVVKLLPAFADCGTQVPVWTGVFDTATLQSVC